MKGRGVKPLASVVRAVACLPAVIATLAVTADSASAQIAFVDVSTQYREQNGGYHRWSQNSTRVHAGFAGNTSANVTVEWSDGTSSSHRGLPAGRLYLLRQAGTAVVVPR